MPLDRGIIDQQLQELEEGSHWWDQRELRDLPAVLDRDEQILAIARGRIARVRFVRRSWLIVVTDHRLVCLRSARRSGWVQREVTADQLTRLSLRIGPLRGRVRVVAGGRTYRLLVPRPAAYKLLTALANLGPGASNSLPGFGPTRMVQRVMGHVLALPAAAFSPNAAAATAPAWDTSEIDHRLDSLEAEVHGLREQVDFLEQLLRQRHLLADADASGKPEDLESR